MSLLSTENILKESVQKFITALIPVVSNAAAIFVRYIHDITIIEELIAAKTNMSPH
jgi:hypothetical protein